VTLPMSRQMDRTSSSDLRAEATNLWPALSYHYGLSFEDITRMPRWARRLYAEALPRLRAEDLQLSIEAASYPHMKPAAQRKIQRSLERALKDSSKEQLTDDTDFQSRMDDAGIGLEEVSGNA